MTINAFLSSLDPARNRLLSEIHQVILEQDKNAIAEIGIMMGKEMIIYNTSGIFKYGLTSVKSHMSLHLMPIYGSTKLHSKYEKLLFKAKFQKGCINFKKSEDVPIDIIARLIDDCSRVDLMAIRESFKANPGKKYF